MLQTLKKTLTETGVTFLFRSVTQLARWDVIAATGSQSCHLRLTSQICWHLTYNLYARVEVLTAAACCALELTWLPFGMSVERRREQYCPLPKVNSPDISPGQQYLFITSPLHQCSWLLLSSSLNLQQVVPRMVSTSLALHDCRT